MTLTIRINDKNTTVPELMRAIREVEYSILANGGSVYDLMGGDIYASLDSSKFIGRWEFEA